MRNVLSIAGGLALLLAAAPPAGAHHAFASEFDSTRPITLQGTVTQMDWTNPHAWIHIDVKGPDGTVEKWDIEGGAPNALLRRGWTKKSIPVGLEIVVNGYASRDGANKANGRDITLPDGRGFFMGSEGSGAPAK